MRQQGGDQPIELLNSVRVGNLFADDAFFLKSENLQEQATKISAIDKVPPEILPSYYIIF